MHSARFMDPFWQLIQEDLVFLVPAKGIGIKRVKKNDEAAVKRNVAGMIGNLITICARENLTAAQVLGMIQRMHVFPVIQRYFKERNMDLVAVHQHLETALIERRLVRKAA